jgi:hypothetical protein
MKNSFTTYQSKASVHKASTGARVHGFVNRQQMEAACFLVVVSATNILIHQYSFI